MSIDTTVSVAFLPSHLADAAVSATRLLDVRAAEKTNKHAAGCAELNRTLLPFVSDTEGGIGPDAFVYWLKGTYAADQLRARADGDDGTRAPFALENLLCELLAVLVRDNYTMIERLSVRDRA